MVHDTSFTSHGFHTDENELQKSFSDDQDSPIPFQDTSIRNDYNVQEIKINCENIPSNPFSCRQQNCVAQNNFRGMDEPGTLVIRDSKDHFLNDDNEDVDDSLLSYFNKSPKLNNAMTYIWKTLLLLVYLGYFTAVLLIRFSSKQIEDNRWCNGEGFLIIMTTMILKPNVGKVILICLKKIYSDSSTLINVANLRNKRNTSVLLFGSAILLLGIFLYFDTKGDRARLIPILGILVFCMIGFLFSTAPFKISWRPVICGFGLQYIFGFIVIRSNVGRGIFLCVGNKISAFLKYPDVGSRFVFGQYLTEMNIFALKITSIIFLFGFCIQILYYYGVIQWIIIKLGWVLQMIIGTTAIESVNAVANIFLGPAETCLLLKPYISAMTRSELHAIMTNSFASTASSCLAIYISLGVSPAHLLSAAVMSAPAALATSKIFYPETEISKTNADDIKIIRGNEMNPLHAGIEGVANAIPLVANIMANILAIISFIAFIDEILNWACVLINLDDGTCSMSNIFGYAFMPLAWVMGVPWSDCYLVGQLIGLKTAVNEFVGYLKLVEYKKDNVISRRSEIIATYALCGFSNIGSIGVQAGCVGAVVPERKKDLIRLSFRSMVAGSFACFFTACVAVTLTSADDQDTPQFQNFS